MTDTERLELILRRAQDKARETHKTRTILPIDLFDFLVEAATRYNLERSKHDH